MLERHRGNDSPAGPPSGTVIAWRFAPTGLIGGSDQPTLRKVVGPRDDSAVEVPGFHEALAREVGIERER
jgi:hypothetical protein